MLGVGASERRGPEARAAELPMMVLTFFLTFGGFLANFERLVLFCIEANLCNQIFIGKHFLRSTRFSYFCTIPSSKIQLNFVKHFHNFAVSFSKIH